MPILWMLAKKGKNRRSNSERPRTNQMENRGRLIALLSRYSICIPTSCAGASSSSSPLAAPLDSSRWTDEIKWMPAYIIIMGAGKQQEIVKRNAFRTAE